MYTCTTFLDISWMSIVSHDRVVSKFLLCSCLFLGDTIALLKSYIIIDVNETSTHGDSKLAISSCKTYYRP